MTEHSPDYKFYAVNETNTLIVGASMAGLACAACLGKKNIDFIIIEKQDKVAMPWRNHYDRLHLHTNKGISNLPFKKFNSAAPRYPSRQQVIDYADAYQKEFNINPVFNSTASSIKKTDDHWITETNSGTFKSKYLIMATGPYGKPRPIDFEGMNSFPGKIIHSRDYKTGKDFSGQNVLVVGFGNSACEIAIDLYEQGAKTSMSVRSPVNVIPRDILGIPVLSLSILLRPLPPRIADTVSRPLIGWTIGNIENIGLKKMPYGPLEQIHRDGNAPVLDIGTIRHIREGHIRIHGDIDRIEGKTVYFSDGKKENFDSIVAAIGYTRENDIIVDIDKKRYEDLRRPASRQKFFGEDGLYFCGYWISPTGQLREIGLDAKKIARDIAQKKL